MGASQEKRRRHSELSEGMDRQRRRQEAELKKKKLERIRNVIIGIAVAVLVITIIIMNSTLFYTSIPAVQVGGRSYSAAEVSYYYYSNYYALANSGYASLYGLDTTLPLDDQMYDESLTWHDYLKQTAIDSLTTVAAMLNAAEADGYTLSQEGREEITTEINTLELYSSSYGYTSLNQFLVARYGRGMTREILDKILHDYTLSNEYAEHKTESFSYSDEEIEAYYEENKDSFDGLRYRLFQIRAEADEENGIDEEAAKADASEKADNVAAAESEDEFIAKCLENASESDAESYADESYSLKTRMPGNTLSDTYSEWLLDASREYGDTTKIESGSIYYVLFFIERDDNRYNLKNVRHMLVKGDEDASTLEEDAKEEAKSQLLMEAENLFELWNAGDATEDSFAELANTWSQDSGSNTKGGLYEDVAKWAMVPEFNDFIYDPARQPGDTGIVYGETSSYFGYHVMYYVGESAENYRSILARTELQNNAFAQWNTDELAKYTVSTGLPLRFVGK